MALEWFKVTSDFAGHPKLSRLAAELGISTPAATGLVIRLWTWTARYAPDGSVTRNAAGALDEALSAGLETEEGQAIAHDLCVTACVTVGWIEALDGAQPDGDLVVHDWASMQPDHVELHDKKREQGRVRAQRFRDRNALRVTQVTQPKAPKVTQVALLDKKRSDKIKEEEPPLPPSGGLGVAGAQVPAPAPEPTPAQAELLKPPDSAAEVFSHWLRVMGRGPQTELDKKRRRAIEKQLKLGRTVADLKRAVDGCRGDPWSMGANPERKRWDELALILRDAEHVEKFLAQATAPPVALGHDGIAVAAQARGPPARAGAHVLVHANPNEPRVPGRKEL